MPLIVEQFICRSDNYGVLLHDPDTGMTAAIDAPEEAAIAERIRARGWNLDHIFVTHHHADHVEGNVGLKRMFGATITGPAKEADRIPAIDRTVSEGDRVSLGGYEIDVMETPGHTLGHISYLVPGARMAFVADTLFAVGCGRVLEGTMEMMWQSLTKLAALPGDTAIYFGHEYTEANIRFALTIEPDNEDLRARAEEAKREVAAGRATVPTTMGEEKRANVFLRADVPAVATAVGLAGKPAAQVFAEVRARKNKS
jgi:hydroxyacylglutathione hydrolase